MKVLFLYPDLIWSDKADWSGEYYTGIAALSAYIRRSGHETALLHAVRPLEKQALIEKVRAENPNLIAISTTTLMYHEVKRWCQWLEEEEIDIPTVCGGVHPTLAPEEVIEEKGIDMVCVGEGEGALLDICRALERGDDVLALRNTPNLWLKANGTIYKNPPRPLIEDLNSLPFADTEIYDYENLYWGKRGTATIMASRGCPYDCSYCCNHALKEIYENKKCYTRFKKVDFVIEELKTTLSLHRGMKMVHFDDDILALKMDWFEEFVSQYRREIGLPLTCNIRPNLVNERVVTLLKEAGCKMIGVGIESGNEKLRHEVLNRHISDSQIQRAFDLIHQAGIYTWSFTILGLPRETPCTLLDSVKMNAKTKANYFQVSLFYPFERTRAYEHCLQGGTLFESEFYNMFYYDHIKFLPHGLTKDQLTMFKGYFPLLVAAYRVIERLPSPLARVASRGMDRFLLSSWAPYVLNRALRKSLYYLKRALENTFIYRKKRENLAKK